MTAVTGGPRGSLTLNRYNAYGKHRAEPWNFNPDVLSIGWTQGRWPWKSGIASGVNYVDRPSNATYLFRSGITGTEFVEGATFAGWIRIHEEHAQGDCNILSLFEGRFPNPKFTNGFNLWHANGTLGFATSSTEETANGASVVTQILPGIWHHFAVTLDTTSLKLYLNGELKDEKPFSGRIIPVTWRDIPLVGPFHEMGFEFGHFMLVGMTVPKADQTVSRFDIDELSINKRALSADQIKHQETSGRPALTPEEQRAVSRAQAIAQKQRDRIKLDIPKDTGGYFRINTPIPATVRIPDDGSEARTVIFSLESLEGKPFFKRKRTLGAGERLVENILPPACGVFYLDIEVQGADGKRVKCQRYCLGIVPPAPKELTVNNPIACWNDNSELFHFDAPIRRMFYFQDQGPAVFQKQYDDYNRIIPNFRAYAGFGVNTNLYPEALEALRGKNIFGLEFTSEPHEPYDTQAYVDALKVADEMFRPVFPGILFFPPGIEPTSLSVLAGILKHGGATYMDGVSFHPYTGQPLQDYLNPDNATQRLKKLLATGTDKKLPLWCTESGVLALPRRNDGRPMTGKDAFSAGFSGGHYSGVAYFPFFVTLMPEADAAALQCHDILLKMADGYQMYTVMAGLGDEGGGPGLRGVAVTTLAGQVLNNQVAVTPLPLASVSSFCALIENTDHTTTAALFSMEPATENFKVSPNATFRTMDMLGNAESVQANADGLLSIPCSRAPVYVFDVPADLQAVAPLRLKLPTVLPENNLLTGKLSITNQLSVPLVGKLTAVAIPGASITFSKSEISLAPGHSETITVDIRADALKRRLYTLDVELRNRSETLISSTRAPFQSPGMIRMILVSEAPFKLDGNEEKWKDIPPEICEDVDSVVHGKPNTAEIWLPQWRGKDDLSFTVKTVWRKDDGIYFLLKVKDNIVCPAPENKTSSAWRYDCLELYFDSREYAKQGTPLSDGMDQVIIIPQVGETVAPCQVWYAFEGLNQVDVECVGRKTADGYLIEGKVTPNAKSSFRVQGGSQFRMDFMIDDADGLEPKLLRKAAMALHGLFGNYRNSDVWGRYELSLDDD